MRELIEGWKKYKGYVSRIEELYEKLSTKYDNPPPWMLFLPVAYQAAVEHPKIMKQLDEHAVILLGQYFGTKHPELKGYFTSTRQRESIEEMRETIERFFEERR